MLGMAGVSRKQKSIILSVASLLLMAATVPAAIWVTHTQGAELGNARARCHKGAHDSHKVVIEAARAKPIHVDAKKCDVLMIVNLDDNDRLVAFGRHDSHISYDGVSEKNLRQGESLTVTLVRTGEYLFHDHLDDRVKGTFEVR
jgi:hypothetical protein